MAVSAIAAIISAIVTAYAADQAGRQRQKALRTAANAARTGSGGDGSFSPSALKAARAEQQRPSVNAQAMSQQATVNDPRLGDIFQQQQRAPTNLETMGPEATRASSAYAGASAPMQALPRGQNTEPTVDTSSFDNTMQSAQTAVRMGEIIGQISQNAKQPQPQPQPRSQQPAPAFQPTADMASQRLQQQQQQQLLAQQQQQQEMQRRLMQQRLQASMGGGPYG